MTPAEIDVLVEEAVQEAVPGLTSDLMSKDIRPALRRAARYVAERMAARLAEVEAERDGLTRDGGYRVRRERGHLLVTIPGTPPEEVSLVALGVRYVQYENARAAVQDAERENNMLKAALNLAKSGGAEADDGRKNAPAEGECECGERPCIELPAEGKQVGSVRYAVAHMKPGELVDPEPAEGEAHPDECAICSGEYCVRHFASPCECDALDRHCAPAEGDAEYESPEHRRIVAEFWDALGDQQEWLSAPRLMSHDPIWKMTALDGFLFDDAFWAVFARFPFRICHVSYSGAPWSHEGGAPEMVLRFTLDEPAEGEDERLAAPRDSGERDRILDVLRTQQYRYRTYAIHAQDAGDADRKAVENAKAWALARAEEAIMALGDPDAPAEGEDAAVGAAVAYSRARPGWAGDSREAGARVAARYAYRSCRATADAEIAALREEIERVRTSHSDEETEEALREAVRVNAALLKERKWVEARERDRYSKKIGEIVDGYVRDSAEIVAERDRLAAENAKLKRRVELLDSLRRKARALLGGGA